MTPELLLAWSIATDGLLGRAELRASVDRIDAHPLLVEHLVESAGSRAAGQAMASGLHVAGGCGRRDCVVVVEGLATALTTGQAAVEQALSAAARLDCPERRALRRAWRGRPYTPSLVLEAALTRAVGDPLVARVNAAGERPRSSLRAISRAQAQIVAAFGVVPVATALASPTLDPPVRTWVDWPGAARVQVAVAWASSGEGDDLVRDGALAGDFESLLVQALREDGGLTYDVEPDQGEGWAAAVFDVAASDLAPALAESERLLAQPLDDALLAGAHLRLLARHAATRDSLAGQLAQLPSVPESPPVAPARARVLAWAAVGDPELAPEGWTHSTRCAVVGNASCRR